MGLGEVEESGGVYERWRGWVVSFRSLVTLLVGGDIEEERSGRGFGRKEGGRETRRDEQN